jgi:hypothetical protein
VASFHFDDWLPALVGAPVLLGVVVAAADEVVAVAPFEVAVFPLPPEPQAATSSPAKTRAITPAGARLAIPARLGSNLSDLIFFESFDRCRSAPCHGGYVFGELVSRR